MASLGDEVGSEGVLSCPSVAWDFGDGPALIQDRDCAAEQQRAFSIRHTYTAPGAYEATARILGADIEASAPVQILVEGATPTPLPEGVLGFPPAVVTSQAADPEKGAGASEGDPDATGTALAALPEARAALELNERPLSAELPADVLVLLDEPGAPAPGGSEWLWRVGAEDGAVTAEAYARSSTRVAASDADRGSEGAPMSSFAADRAGGVAVFEEDSDTVVLMKPASGDEGQAPSTAAGTALWSGVGPAEDLVLSADGSRLAFAVEDRVFVVDVPGAASERPGSENDRSGTADPAGVSAVPIFVDASEPVAWDRSGDRLLLRTSRGDITVFNPDTEEVVRLPVRGGAEAGWLAIGRPGESTRTAESVLWLAGPGLRLLTLGDALQQTTLLDDASVTSVRQAADGSLLAIVGQGSQQQLVRFDLARDELEPVPVGETFALRSGETALPAPNGAGVLIYGPSGARYLDHRSREQWLLRAPVRQAEWSPVSPSG